MSTASGANSAPSPAQMTKIIMELKEQIDRMQAELAAKNAELLGLKKGKSLK